MHVYHEDCDVFCILGVYVMGSVKIERIHEKMLPLRYTERIKL
jgi:hypothetical protein